MRLLTLILELIRRLLDAKDKKDARDKKENLDNERKKAMDDPAGYVNDRWMRDKPDSDMPSNTPQPSDRRNQS